MTVNELQRLSYLDAMGVSTHVSRRQLAGAAHTKRLRIIAHPPPDPVSSPGEPVAPEVLRDVRAGLGERTRTADPAPTPAAVEAGVTGPQADIPVFSLAAAHAGGWLWLEEFPRGRDPGQVYQQLLVSISYAMGWSVTSTGLDIFNWPLNNSAQLDHSEQAARHGVSGFIHARLDRQSPSGVILMGPLTEAWFDRSPMEELRVLELPSGLGMLRDPTLKREAWKILKSLRGEDA